MSVPDSFLPFTVAKTVLSFPPSPSLILGFPPILTITEPTLTSPSLPSFASPIYLLLPYLTHTAFTLTVNTPSPSLSLSSSTSFDTFLSNLANLAHTLYWLKQTLFKVFKSLSTSHTLA